MQQDPIEIWEVQKSKLTGNIKYLITREGKRLEYDHVVDEIKAGQDYLISSEDGDMSKLGILGANTLRTVRDDTELNNLSGNSNLKITEIDE